MILAEANKIDQRDAFGTFKVLEELKRRAAILIQRRNFAIKDNAIDRQLLQGIEQLQVIERLVVARDQAHRL